MVTPVKNVMTKSLFAVPERTSVSQASFLMKDKNIRHLPVFDKNNDVIGVVSQRDLRAVSDPKETTVEKVMHFPVAFLSSETPLREAIFEMLEKKISCLLVSDADDKAIGIVTTDDLLWYLTHLLDLEKGERRPLLTANQRQTLGELANELSLMGI